MPKQAKSQKSSRAAALLLVFALCLPVAARDASKTGYIGIAFYSNCKIKKVYPGSSAEKAGMKEGDRIVSINGLSTDEMGKEQIASRVSGPENTVVNLVIERNGKRFNCSPTRSPSQKSLLEKAGLKELPGKKLEGETKPESPPIIIVKRSKDTDYIEEKVNKALLKIPKKVRDRLALGGLKIRIVPSLIDADPGLRGGRPSGYTHGGGWDNCPGRYDDVRRTIFIGERNGWRNQPMALNQGAEGITVHECGHAFDHQNYCSTSEEFKKAFAEDTRSLTNELRLSYQVYLQEGEAGPSEMFAELFHCFFSNETSHRSMDMAKQFPKCYAYVQGRAKNALFQAVALPHRY